MAISIGTMNMRYKSDEIDKVQVVYRIKTEDENLSGTGKFEIEVDDFDKGTSHIKNLAGEHYEKELEAMKIKIEEVDIGYDEGDNPDKEDDDPVVVIFSGKTKNRELKITGNFELSIDEYEDNRAVKDLLNKAKNYAKEKAFHD